MEPTFQSEPLNDIRGSKRIPLLTLNTQSKEYSLSQKARDFLNSLQGKCYVISVSGSPKTGKCSLLNLLISLFMKDASQEEIPYQDIFTIGNTGRSTKQDVGMYCLTVKGKNFIFLDVECDGDPRRQDAGSWISAHLLKTAVGVSHVHVYNCLGLPQENSLSDFEVINTAIRQLRIHDHFKTEFFFVAKDDPFKSESMSAEEFTQFEPFMNERFRQSSINCSLRRLPNPPDHIAEKDPEESCVTSTGFLCKKCQSHSFFSKLQDLSKELAQHLPEIPSFLNGNHLRIALEYLINMNQRELPSVADEGQMSTAQRRLERLEKECHRLRKELNIWRKELDIWRKKLDKWKEEAIRIQELLLAIEKYQAQAQAQAQHCLKEVQILNNHSETKEKQFVENVGIDIKELAGNPSLIGEKTENLSGFTHRSPLNGAISALYEKGKKALEGIHITHVAKMTEKTVVDLREHMITGLRRIRTAFVTCLLIILIVLKYLVFLFLALFGTAFVVALTRELFFPGEEKSIWLTFITLIVFGCFLAIIEIIDENFIKRKSKKQSDEKRNTKQQRERLEAPAMKLIDSSNKESKSPQSGSIKS